LIPIAHIRQARFLEIYFTFIGGEEVASTSQEQTPRHLVTKAKLRKTKRKGIRRDTTSPTALTSHPTMSSTAAAASSSSTFSLFLACHGNNEAVSCLEHGEYDKAAGILANALRSVVHAVKHIKTFPEAERDNSPARGSCVQSEPSSLLNLGATSIAHQGDNMAFSEAPLREKYMYMHAWSITSVNRHSMLSETVNEVSMILVFNLALSFHVLALSLAGNTNLHSQVDHDQAVSHTLIRTATLHNANSLYEKAYRLLVNGHMHYHVNATRAMAILNNLALTYSALNCRKEADKCWRLLLPVVVHVNYSTSLPTDTSNCHESLLAFGFLGNVIHLLLGNKDDYSSSPSPAA
jgi:hypothetical protein